MEKDIAKILTYSRKMNRIYKIECDNHSKSHIGENGKKFIAKIKKDERLQKLQDDISLFS